MNRRSGFTLLELLIVISIIAILVALILPAVNSVTRRAKEADAFGEIQGIANAADSFKAQYHVYPPSSITLYERASDWNTPAAAPHRALIRRIFGTEFDFENRDPVTRAPRNRDINGNGNDTETLVLSGQECLVFFLGGPPKPSGSSFIMQGFSSNRRDPFSPAGSSRHKFFTAWDAGRLVDTDGDGMPEYLPKYASNLTAPLLYFSTTNASNAYQPTDCPGTLTDVYLQAANQPFKPDAFQIVSPGFDGQYGIGGIYQQSSPALLGAREPENDNITNFRGGRLGD